jgi:hypothetical protein
MNILYALSLKRSQNQTLDVLTFFNTNMCIRS